MADDPELAKWRAQRMAQMQGGSGKGAPSAQEMEEQRKKQEYGISLVTILPANHFLVA